MRHTVLAEEPMAMPDGAGGQAITWVERLRFKASIEPLTGREQMRANQVIADMNTRIVLRWSPKAAAIKPTWRLRHGGVIYNIAQPPIERKLGRTEIEILAQSGLNEG